MSIRVFYWSLDLVLSLISRVTVTGFDYLLGDFKDSGKRKLIIVANHLGILDAPLAFVLFRKLLKGNPMATIAEKYEKYLPIRWIVTKLDLLFLDRFNPDFRTLIKVIRRLNAGNYLLFSPEGTRSPTASLIEGKPGAAYLAAKTQATIIPVGVTGSEDSGLRRQLRRFKKVNIRVLIGQPFQIPVLPRKNKSDFLSQQTDEIMCQIAALLPPPYRGFYADHPRLLELLKVE